MADYDFLSASDGGGDSALMHVTNDRAIGSMTIHVDTVSHVAGKLIGTYGPLLPSGLIDAANKRDFRGHVDSGNVIIDAFEPGNADAGTLTGWVVVVKPSTGWANRVATFIQNATNFGTPESLWAATFHAASAIIGGDVAATGNVTAASFFTTAATNHVGISGMGLATSSTTYTPFAGTNSVTVTVGASGKVWVQWGAEAFSPTGGGFFLNTSLSASGANTIATGLWETGHKTSSANSEESTYRRVLLSGLTPGSTTFLLNGKVSGGSGVFSSGDLNVEAI